MEGGGQPGLRDIKLVVGTLTFLLTLYISACNGKTINDIKRLANDLLADYNKNFRPRYNQSEPVVVQVVFELATIQEFDEVQETLTVTGVLNLDWFDDFMKWDPTKYGYTYDLTFPEDMVWSPNLVLVNTVDKIEKVGDSWHIVRVTFGGLTFYFPGDVFSASCTVDVTYYPFDRQTCEFTFSTWGYGSNEIYLVPGGVQTSYFSENGAWNFLGGETLADDLFITFFINLERKPRFIVVNVILPIVFMSALNILIFLIPTESGERLSYCITVLLALAVFLTLVGDNLPKTSSPMALFSFYLLSVLLLSICITLATIFSLHLYYQDEEKPVPEGLKTFVECMRGKCGRRKRRRERRNKSRKNSARATKSDDLNFAALDVKRFLSLDTEKNATPNHTDVYMTDRPNDSAGRQTSRPVFKGNFYLYKPEKKSTDSDQQRKENVTWKDVSIMFDKLCFIIFFVFLVAITLAFFLVISLNGQK